MKTKLSLTPAPRAGLAAIAAAAAALAACHGGGAYLPMPASPVAGAAQSVADSASVPDGKALVKAWGALKDDPSGAALANVPVRLYPWKPCMVVTSQHLKCPVPVAQAETNKAGWFEVKAPQGHYLLVIGSDSATDMVRPTIHDGVWLTRGVQKLIAPTIPPLPLVTLAPVELGGAFRLSTLDPVKEVPCLKAYDVQRQQRHLLPGVEDEWLIESIRQTLEFHTNPKSRTATPDPGEGYGWFTSANAGAAGGVACGSALVTAVFDKIGERYSGKPQNQWFGGRYEFYKPFGRGSRQGIGYANFPFDPRTGYVDPNLGKNWWP